MERQNQVLVGTSVVQGLQNELEKKRLQVKTQEEENITKMDKKKDISREYIQIIQSIRNLYLRCVSTMNAKHGYSASGGQKEGLSLLETLDGNLDLIGARISDLIEIFDEYGNVSGFANSFSSSTLPVSMSGSSSNLPPPPGDLKDSSLASGGAGGFNQSKSVISAGINQDIKKKKPKG